MNKLREIEQLSLGEASSIARLVALSADNDEEVRFRAIEAIGNVPVTAETRATILAALTDPDDIVRTAAVEILGIQEFEDAEKFLVDSMNDESELVRTAAIVSLGLVGSKTSVWTLEQKYRAISCRNAELLTCAVALYSLGRRSYLDEALSFLTHESYQLRCAAANLLGSFTNTEDISIVLEALRSALDVESTNAAKSSMNSAVDDLAPI